jgi:SAM-dependent methyltransferase
MPSSHVYKSARLAEGYAYARPPVHPRVIGLLAEHLKIARPVGRALDVGCGAGRSTAALRPIARITIGLEPERVMLTHCRAVAPQASFAVGLAEALPFERHSFDLITAAGSLNYVDLDRFLPEAARVLTLDGTLAIYDFSAGRRFREDGTLDRWFSEFEDRYPFQPGYALDPRAIAYGREGLRLEACHTFEIALPLRAGDYLRYVLSETNVERAVGCGVPADDIRQWCRRAIETLFGETTRDVLFSGYIAYVRRRMEPAN